jgi:hypothetical protein
MVFTEPPSLGYVILGEPERPAIVEAPTVVRVFY